jgi:hypothetical protein
MSNKTEVFRQTLNPTAAEYDRASRVSQAGIRESRYPLNDTASKRCLKACVGQGQLIQQQAQHGAFWHFYFRS